MSTKEKDVSEMLDAAPAQHSKFKLQFAAALRSRPELVSRNLQTTAESFYLQIEVLLHG